MAANTVPGRADYIIIGAGVVGRAIACHLAELGAAHIVVLDKGSLTTPLGSSGHAPGLLGRNSPSPAMAALATYSADFYERITADQPGVDRVGSLEVTRSKDTLRLLADKQAVARASGLDAQLVSPAELAELVPYMSADRLAGGLYIQGDAVLDMARIMAAMRAHASERGVSFFEGTPVTGFLRENGHVTGVRTDGAEIRAPKVVLAAGIWGRYLLESAGLDLALFPVEHPYLKTEPLEVLKRGAPFVRDLDTRFYLREHGDQLGYGWYNHRPREADVSALPQADIPYVPKDLEGHIPYDLFPILESAPIKTRLNGIFSMTPDGAPLLGEIERGLWVAEAVWVTHAAAIGRALAEALLGRPASIDVTAFRHDRFSAMRAETRRTASLNLYNDIYAWPLPETA